MAIKDKDIQEDYTINLSGSVSSDYEGTSGQNNIVPFRFRSLGVYNLRGQTAKNHYKTFLGEQKV